MNRNLRHTLTRFLKDLFQWFSRPQEPPLQAEDGQDQSNLTLLIGPGARDFYLYNYTAELEPCSTLVLGGLSLADADRLLEQMPDHESLLLVLPRIQEEEISAIVQLLRGWSESLLCLSIFIRQSTLPYTPPYLAVSEQLLRLLAGINTLSQLEELNFNLEGYLLPADAKEQSLYLPVLAHLKSLNFSSQDEASMLADSFVRYLPSNGNLAFLGIHNMINQKTFQCLLEMGPWVAQSLRSFISGWRLTTHQLGRLCGHFPGIQKLLLPLPGRDYNLPTVTHLMRPLKDLHTLILLILTIQPEIDAIQGHLQQVAPEEEPLLDALRQVTRLELNISDMHSHQELVSLSSHRFFPRLKKLFVSFFAEECAICGNFGPLQGRQDRPEDEARAEACAQAMETQMRQRFLLLQEVKIDFTID